MAYLTRPVLGIKLCPAAARAARACSFSSSLISSNFASTASPSGSWRARRELSLERQRIRKRLQGPLPSKFLQVFGESSAPKNACPRKQIRLGLRPPPSCCVEHSSILPRCHSAAKCHSSSNFPRDDTRQRVNSPPSSSGQIGK